MTFLALAAECGAFGASRFVVAASSSPERATMPKPRPVFDSSSLLFHIQKLVQVHQPPGQLRVCRGLRPQASRLPLDELRRFSALPFVRLAAQYATPGFGNRFNL